MKQIKWLAKLFIMICVFSSTSVCMADNNSQECTQVESISTQIAKGAFFAGNKAFKEGRYDAAISLYSKAIEINPSFWSAYLNRGTAYERKNKFDEAMKNYDEAIRLNSKSAIAYNGRAIILNKTHRQAEAIEAWKEAIKADSKFAEPYFYLGRVLQNTPSESIKYLNFFLNYAKPGDARIKDAEELIEDLQNSVQENETVANTGASNDSNR